MSNESDGFDWKDIVRTVAPSVATAFGTPVAGLATKMLVDGLLGDDDEEAKKNPEKALSRLVKEADPATMAQLKQIENDFVVKLQELEIRLEELDNEDRASARAREANVDDDVNEHLAYLITLGLFGVIILLAFIDLPENSSRSLYILVGALGAAWGQVITYYYGSSRSSGKKNGVIHRMVDSLSGKK